jgi:fused signal recognition particle receptor
MVLAPAGGTPLRGLDLVRRLAAAFSRRDHLARDEAERILLEADFGPAAADDILARVVAAPPDELAPALVAAIAAALDGPGGVGAPGGLARAPAPPTVVLVIGVNGTGKTTTVAKLARRLQDAGRSVLLAAADTFRAGAVDQLAVWAGRLDVPFVGPGGSGSGDPAAVAFDAVTAARARGVDTVLVDTAGRLHTDERLLAQLQKIVRVVGKPQPGAPHEVLLVLDATTGQNTVQQTRVFAGAVPLTGLVVTKLDGTARGGSLVAVRRAVAVPIRFLGTGEGLADLEPFDARRFAERLVAG